MRCENDLGQHEFINVMFSSDFFSFDGFLDHLGIFETERFFRAGNFALFSFSQIIGFSLPVAVVNPLS